MSFEKIAVKLRNNGFSNRHGSYANWTSVRRIIGNPLYTGRISFNGVVVENAHEAIISKKQFEDAQNMHNLRQEQCKMCGFQSKYMLIGMIFCGKCGARYGRYNVRKYTYYACYSRHSVNAAMVKDHNCKNKTWRTADLEAIVDKRVRQLLSAPELAKELAASKQTPVVKSTHDNATIEKRIREIDKQIGKLMDLYQIDGIPPEILGEKINALYHEKSTLESTLVPVDELEINTPSFDLIEALISNAAQIWDFADEAQKRRILQSLIKRIVLTDDEVEIEWNF